jgi:hypothetical protein
MMMHIKKLGVILALLFCLIISVHALPTTGNPTGVTNNQANISCTGVTGTVGWAMWGQNPNGQVWKSANSTAAAGTAAVQIIGAPLMTNTLYYAKCCDETGCTATAKTFTTLAADVITQTTYSAGWTNFTGSRFNLMYLIPDVLGGYFIYVPTTLFFGITLSIIVLGLWRANRGVRVVSILFIIASPFLMAANVGLMLGIPGTLQSLGMACLAVGIAGIFLSFVRRG